MAIRRLSRAQSTRFSPIRAAFRGASTRFVTGYCCLAFWMIATSSRPTTSAGSSPIWKRRIRRRAMAAFLRLISCAFLRLSGRSANALMGLRNASRSRNSACAASPLQSTITFLAGRQITGEGAAALSTTLSEADVRGWARRPATVANDCRANALTVDVEDYFQVEAFFGLVSRDEWDRRECRVERNVDKILELFAGAGVHATFFTLGWVAERYPALVRRIVSAGHELASHGLAHYRADNQSPQQFLNDVSCSKRLLEDVAGVCVNGYRAASFSITQRNLWAFDALAHAGYRYSSSIYPIRHDLYGIPNAPRFAFYPLPGEDFMEIPITSIRAFGRNWPSGGGGYFRLLPYWLSARNLRSVARKDKQPCIFYFHPWEMDAGQPRIVGGPLKSRLRHYTNIRKMQGRICRLLNEFRWKRVDEIFLVKVPEQAVA